MSANQPELEILYRDQYLLAVNKPSGLIVHRGWGTDPVTVYDIVRDKIVGCPVFAMHRLDRGTSGVLLFALDGDTARGMQPQFESGLADKVYLALLRGPLREPISVNHPIKQREKADRVEAVTNFSPIAHVDRWSLVEACPQTGRTHQIRLHAKHLSCPIVGDVRYGKGDVNRLFREEYGLHRLALHCRSIRLSLPDGRMLHIDAGVPPDLGIPMERLGFAPQILKRA